MFLKNHLAHKQVLMFLKRAYLDFDLKLQLVPLILILEVLKKNANWELSNYYVVIANEPSPVSIEDQLFKDPI